MSAIAWTTVENALQAWVASSSGFPGARVIWSGNARERPDSPWISMLVTNVARDGLGWVDVEENPLVFAPVTVTAVNMSTNVVTATAHGLLTGDGPISVVTTGTLPGGLVPGADYWAIATDVNHLSFAGSFGEAIATVPIAADLTSAGSGVVTVISTDDTLRAGSEIHHVVRANYEAKLSVQCYGGTATGDTNPVGVLQNVAMSALLPSVQRTLSAGGVGITDVSAIRSVGAVINSAAWEPRAQMDVTLWIAAQVSETGDIIDNVSAEMDVVDSTGATVTIALDVP